MEQTSKKSTEQRDAVDRQIDENLRRVYDETLKEDLPERFKDLLAQLKTGDKDPANDS
ncbi:NepR family anti-sigma factor [Gymnodinialimonas sp. 2305UL16-5]|uniref:NepR family anti-sigma factor n=1 Tax=Gymnodinialimonas mytili TaxID=3126503 RepID=UPI0030AA8B18